MNESEKKELFSLTGKDFSTVSTMDFSDMKAPEVLTLTDKIRNYRIKQKDFELTKELIKTPEAGLGKRIGAGVSEAVNNLLLVPEEVKNIRRRLFTDYNYPNATREQALALADASSNEIANIKRLRTQEQIRQGIKPDDWVKNLSSGVTQVGMYSLLSYATGGAGLALAGVQEAGEASQDWYESFQEKNKGVDLYDRENDVLAAVGHGAVAGIIERGLGAERLFSPLIARKVFAKTGAKRAIRAGVIGGVGEAAEESLQDVSRYAFGHMTGADTRTTDELLQEMATDAIYAAVVGGVAGGGAYYMNRSKMINKMSDMGMSQTEATQATDEILDEGTQYILNDFVVRDQIQKGYGQEFNNLVTKIKDTITATGRTDLVDEKLDSYAKLNAVNLVMPAINIANLQRIPVSEVLNLANIVVEGNAMHIDMPNINDPEKLEKEIKTKKAELKYLNSQIAVDNKDRKKSLRLKIKILENRLKTLTGNEEIYNARNTAKKAQRDQRVIAETKPEIVADLKGIRNANNENFVYVGETKLPVQYEVRSLDEVQPSHINGEPNPNYTLKELQNRTRGTMIDEAILQNRAANLKPEELGQSPNTQYGAPLVNYKNEVISGNGRLETLRKAYDLGVGQSYINMLNKMGYDTNGIERPVLVRKTVDDLTPEQQVAVAEASNVSQTSAFDHARQAMNDSKKLGKKVIDVITFADNLPVTERQDYIKEDGTYDMLALQRRFDDAVMAYIIGDTKTFDALVLSDKIPHKVSEGLSRQGAAIVQFDHDYPEMGLKKDLRNALVKISAMKNRAEYISVIQQRDIEDGMTFSSDALLYGMAFSNNSSQVNNFMDYYIQRHKNYLEGEKESLLADTLPKFTKEDITSQIIRNSSLTADKFNKEGITEDANLKTLFLNKIPAQDEAYNTTMPLMLEQTELARLDSIYPEYTGETITVDGKERTAYNSNGDRIAKSKEALENFYRWFGDSKVVDKQGRPLVVYHGTNKKFDAFDKGKIGKKHKDLYQGKGFYFTSEYYDAQNYGRRIMPVYLKIENPALSDYNLKPENDGISAAHGVWVAFNPNQIKSTSNRGTYSESENIYYQGGENINPKGIDLDISKYNEEINDLQKMQDENAGKNLYGKEIDKFAEQWMRKREEESIDKESLDELLEIYDYKSLDDVNADIEDNYYKKLRDKPFESEKELEDFLKQRRKEDIEPNLNDLADYEWAEIREEFSNYAKREDFFNKYQLLIKKIMEDNGFFVRYGESRISDSKYLAVYENENSDDPFAQIRISDHDTHKFYGNNINLYTTEPIKEEIDKLKRAFAESQFGIDETYYQSAFAGSRVDYDRPSLEAIGSGEGNQAHGWGLYYALNRDVAEGYRKDFTEGKTNIVIGNKSIEEWVNSYEWNNDTYDIADNIIDDIKRHLENNNVSDSFEARQIILNDIGYHQKSFQYAVKNNPSSDEYYAKREIENLNNLTELLNKIATYSQKEIKVEQQKGQVHEVDIPENPYLLDEQKPFSEQSSYVKEKVIEALKEKITDKKQQAKLEKGIANTNGGAIYNWLARELGTAKQASQLLEKYGIKGITYDGRQDGRCFVIFNPADVRVIQKFYQGSQANGFFDAGLKTVVLGSNFNYGTLPHEFAHFWLDKMFTMWKSGEATPEFNDMFQGLADVLGITKEQSELTRNQQEQYATMTEGYLFNKAAFPDGAKPAMNLFFEWCPEQYQSLLDIGYRDEEGNIHNPIFTDEALKWFDDFYANMVGLNNSHISLIFDNPDDQNGDKMTSPETTIANRERLIDEDHPDSIDVMKNQPQAVKEAFVESQDKEIPLVKEAYEEAITREETREKTIPEKIKQFVKVGRGTNTREGMDRAAQEYIKNNPERAEQIAFGSPIAGGIEGFEGWTTGDPYVENDSGIDRAVLIINVMAKYGEDTPQYAALYHNLALTRSYAGKTGGLTNDISQQFYLKGYAEINRALESKAALARYGKGSNSVDLWNRDIDRFIQDNVDAIFSTEPESAERDKALNKFFEKASKVLGADNPDQFLQESLNRARKMTKKDRQQFIEFARHEIKKKAGGEMSAQEVSKLMNLSIEAQKAAIDIDSNDINKAKSASIAIRSWQDFVNSKGVQKTFLDKLVGEWMPRAMLSGISTHVVNNVSNFVNDTFVKAATIFHFGNNVVSTQVINREQERLWAIYNATGQNLAESIRVDQVSKLHAENYQLPQATTLLQKVDPFRLLGKEDFYFRSKRYLDTLARIASKDAKGDVKEANRLFNEYKKMNSTDERAIEARMQAITVGNIAVFTCDGQLAKMISNMRRELDRINLVEFGEKGHYGLGTLIAPFAKVPANIVGMGLEAIASPFKSLAYLAKIKKNWTIQDTIALETFAGSIAAVLVYIAGACDYEPPYEPPMPYDPEKPYDSIKIGNVWVQVETFGAFSTPLRFALTMVHAHNQGYTNEKALSKGLKTIASQVPLIENNMEFALNKPFRWLEGESYNQVNKAVPALIKPVIRAANRERGANLDWWNPEFMPVWRKKFAKNYGFDGQETSINDWIHFIYGKAWVDKK